VAAETFVAQVGANGIIPSTSPHPILNWRAARDALVRARALGAPARVREWIRRLRQRNSEISPGEINFSPGA
jgi:hypothetical protein